MTGDQGRMEQRTVPELAEFAQERPGDPACLRSPGRALLRAVRRAARLIVGSSSEAGGFHLGGHQPSVPGCVGLARLRRSSAWDQSHGRAWVSGQADAAVLSGE